MAIYNVSLAFFMASFALLIAFLLPEVQANSLAPAPAPAPAPTSDGTTIDQGIAYVLMLLALALTYLIHTLDTPLKI